ncbi:MAG: peptidylprolyl isomerase [Candidatus Aminicenantales bacterium]
MNKKGKLTIIILLTFCSSTFLFAEKSRNRVVARVNGKAITEKNLKEKMNDTINRMYFHRNLTPEKEIEVKKQALEALILEELFYQEAVREKIDVDEKEVTRRFDRIAKRFKSRSEFKKALRKKGYTIKDFKKKIERESLIQEAFRRNVLQKINLSEVDLRRYYDENKSKFKKPESINLQHILIRVKDPTSEASWQEAEKKIMDIYSRLQKGEDFPTLARLYSEDMYRIKGGHLGEVHRGRLAPEIEKEGFSMDRGEISQPIKTELGYHIIKILDKKEARQLEFNEVKEKLKKELEEKFLTETKKEWISQLKAQSKIEVYLKLE